jgi:LysM repeat protein
MDAVFFYPKPVRKITILSSLILVLGMVMAIVPGSAQAATCASNHTVQEGDTTVSIAQFYGVKWGSIAWANNLKEPYRLTPGQVLCIPEEDIKGKDADEEEDDESKSTFDDATFTVTVDRVQVSVAGLKSKNFFVVKARELVPSVSEWSKMGELKVEKNQKVSQFFYLPGSMEDSALISVCLKNSTTDELTCQTVVLRWTVNASLFKPCQYSARHVTLLFRAENKIKLLRQHLLVCFSSQAVASALAIFR